MNTELRYAKDDAKSLIERIYKGRGFNNASEWKHYLNVSKDDLINPLELDNMEEGAKLLIKHIQQRHKVMVQIDSDCDGFTSAAVLINYLNCLFPAFVQNNIFYRPHTEKQHGIIVDTVPSDVKLVIAPDSSSNEVDVHQQLQDMGIDVLVIDHHNVSDEDSQSCACIINNQICDYPTKSLSGVGVVYKFCSYIDSLLGVEYANQFLDLVALGMIADVMELKDYETRYLVNQGLQNIENPFFKGLCAKDTYHFSPGEMTTPKAIAWNIAPAVNAVARMGSYEEKNLLFEAMLDYKAYNSIPSTKRGHKGELETVVEQACRNCTNIRNRQNKARDASLEIIERLIKEERLLENQILVVKMKKEYNLDKNITGLIANKILSTYQKPVLILNEVTDDESQETLWVGSGRNLMSKDFKDFQQFILESNYADFAEGHSNAFGAQFTDKNLKAFIEYSNEKLQSLDFTPSVLVDLDIPASLIGDYIPDFYEIGELDYIWGKGVEEPVIMLRNIKVNKNVFLFGSTLKIAIPSTEEISLVKFKSSNEEYESLYSDLGCVTINAVGQISLNKGWDGKPQIIIDDYSIVNKEEYYF